MRTPVKFLMLHSPVFISGTHGNQGKSLGTQLNAAKVPGIKIEYSASEDKLYVSIGSDEITMPTTSAVYWISGAAEGIAQAVTPIAKPIIPSAQVETPQSHVHAGPGQGKTGRG